MRNKIHTIRQATENDNETIAQLSVTCWQQAYKDILNQDFLAQLDWRPRASGRKKFYQENKTAAGYIAEVEGRAIGFCDAGPARVVEKMPAIDRSYGEIYAIYVLQEFQKQGIGLALCKAACEHLISKGFARCIIWTLVDNKPAIAFYNAIGCIQQAWKKITVIEEQNLAELAFTIDLL